MPEDVQTVLEGLRNREGPPAEAKALVRSRLDQTLSLGWGPSAAPLRPPVSPPAPRAPALRLSWSAGRLMLAAAGMVGVGGLLWYAGRTAPPSREPLRSVAPLLPATPGMETAPAPGALPTQPEPGTAAVGTPTAGEAQPAVPATKATAQPDRSRPARRANAETNPPSPATGAEVAGSPGLAGERRLLDQARNALRDGDASRALAAVGEHARLYPEGQLAEEREVLGIQAMVRSGSYAEARVRAQAFLSNFPDSPLHRVVQATVDSIP